MEVEDVFRKIIKILPWVLVIANIVVIVQELRSPEIADWLAAEDAREEQAPTTCTVAHFSA